MVTPFIAIFVHGDINGPKNGRDFLFILEPIFLVCKKYMESFFTTKEKGPKCVLCLLSATTASFVTKSDRNKNKCKLLGRLPFRLA